MLPLGEESYHRNESFWTQFLDLLTNPAHLAFELFFTVMFDGIFIALIWGVVIKRYVMPRLRKQIHADIDKEHGVQEHEQK